MGLLKHVLLPLFGIVHLLSMKAQMDVAAWAEMLFVEAPADNNVLLLHSMGILRAYNAAFVLMCLIGIISESAHFRGVLIVVESIVFGMATVDAYNNELDYYVPAGLTTVAIIGAAIHQKEPGIFTADKAKTAKQN